MTPTETFLAKCLELSERASKAPWEARNNNALNQWTVYPNETRRLYFGDGKTICGPEDARQYPLEHTQANAEFVAFSREALPKVCEALRIAMSALNEIWERDCSPQVPQLAKDVKAAKDALDAVSKIFNEADGG